MFKLENLPKDVREKIHDIVATPNEEEIIGIVNLKDGFVFKWDDSHVTGFTSRQDLIDIVRTDTKKEA